MKARPVQRIADLVGQPGCEGSCRRQPLVLPGASLQLPFLRHVDSDDDDCERLPIGRPVCRHVPPKRAVFPRPRSHLRLELDGVPVSSRHERLAHRSRLVTEEDLEDVQARHLLARVPHEPLRFGVRHDDLSCRVEPEQDHVRSLLHVLQQALSHIELRAKGLLLGDTRSLDAAEEVALVALEEDAQIEVADAPIAWASASAVAGSDAYAPAAIRRRAARTRLMAATT